MYASMLVHGQPSSSVFYVFRTIDEYISRRLALMKVMMTKIDEYALHGISSVMVENIRYGLS